MAATIPAQIYKRNAVTSATPGQLVLMLLDGVLRFTGQAAKGLDNPDFIRSHEISHNNIIRSQSIVTELKGTLNFEKGGQPAILLSRVYDYLLLQLHEANKEKTRQPLFNVLRFAGEIRDTWAEMLTKEGPGSV